jgi:proteasome-associated ATPase
VKIKVDRPDAARPARSSRSTSTSGCRWRTTRRGRRARWSRRRGAQLIDRTVEKMYADRRRQRVPRGHLRQREKEVLYFKDFNSGAMIESVVARAKKLAIKRLLATGERGLTTDDCSTAIREEFRENEDLPNTTNPDDWARISGKKGERIVYVRTLISGDGTAGRAIENLNPGQYL